MALMRSYPEPTIDLADGDVRSTRRCAPPAALLQLARQRDSDPFARETAPAPFWVSSVDDPTVRIPALRLEEPEPRQTTPSMVRAVEQLRPRRRWLSIAFAFAMVGGAAALANVFATALP